ncbi:MAG: response regulator transcription factor [Candidatus Dormibacteria bacterium]
MRSERLALRADRSTHILEREMTERGRILVVDDEPAITDFIALGLHHEGYEVATAGDGHQGLRAVDEFKPDLVILDVMMPRLDGFELCRAIAGEPRRGIIILSARDEITDRIHGLELGADDYLVKPFEFGELLARVKAVLRRRTPDLNRLVQVGDLSIDTATRDVRVGERRLDLSVREYDLLHYLAVHADEVMLRQRILDEVWGHNFFGDENNVEVYIRYLRQKLADGEHQRIQTVRGVGYRLHAVGGVAQD